MMFNEEQSQCCLWKYIPESFHGIDWAVESGKSYLNPYRSGWIHDDNIHIQQ